MLANNPNHPGSDPLVPFLDSRQRLRSLDSDWVFKSAHLLLDPYQCIKYIYIEALRIPSNHPLEGTEYSCTLYVYAFGKCVSEVSLLQ
jgi:hypothetical protein